MKRVLILVRIFFLVERPRGNAVLITAKDMIEASKFLEAIMDMNTLKD